MYNKKLSIFITLIFIIAISLQYSVNANSTEQTLISRINKIAQQVSRLTSENVEEDSNEVVTIKVNDDVFYEAIVGTYGGNPTENALEFTMTREQINALTEFEYTGSDLKKIKDITGIENFKNLRALKLNKNNITDITKIGQLTNLTHLEIKSNGLKNLPDLSNLTKLSMLDISDNSISNLEGISSNFALTELYASSNKIVNIIPITALNSIRILDLSNNNISDVATINRLVNLEELDLSLNTSIRKIEAITDLRKLTKLSLANNNSITDLTKIVDKETDNKTPKLINLQELNLENVNSSYSRIVVKDLKGLVNLKILNMNNNTLEGIRDIIELTKLEKLYLNKNNIDSEDLQNLVEFEEKTINGEKVKSVKRVSKIQEIRMSENNIEDISILSYMADTITYLDLSKNHIHDIRSIEQLSKLEPKNLYLQDQKANFMIKKKSNTNVEQKIILENIVQTCKVPSSKIYAENANFVVTGSAALNIDTYITPNGENGKYNEKPGYYNIVFPADVQLGEVGTVTINGGRASGSKYTYTITNSTGNKVYDSIVFEDYYLTNRVAADLIEQERNIVGCIPYIINIEYPEIEKVTELTLTGDEGRRVKNIKGLESFIKLKALNLATNSISSDSSISKIDLLKDLPNIERLNLSDNELKTADVITKFKSITHINLSNNDISDLEPFREWIDYLKNNKTTSKLEELNISGNTNITDLTPIKEITTINSLNVSGNNITDIKPIEDMTNLNILDISNNKIENISILEGLTNLTSLYLGTNKVKDLSSISNLRLYNLDISNNRIGSLEDIKNMSSLIKLIANTNKISTIEPIKDLVIKDFELNYQKLHYALQETDENIVTLELPKLFTESKEENSMVYTANNFECNNCKLTEDGKVEIDIKELGHKIATVKIKGGNATGSQLAIAESLKPVLKYSTEEKTNQDVTVTISFDGRQANIINNDGKNTYTFTENGEFTFDYEDEYGFSGTITAKVTWIDKEGPKATVTLSKTEITKEDVIVTITANEECKAVEGWTLSEDKKILTKTYSNNTNEKITLEDEIGNKSEIDVIITNIDKTAPEITGVVDGQTYNHVVTPVITDENLKLVELKKDGKIVENYTSETPITENGEYILTAKDRADNTTTVNFIINIKYDEKILSSIAITSEPSKKDYVAGENFDPAGMVVTATYNDGSKKVVTNYTVTDGDNLEVGKTNVTISYTENGVTKPATQEITVVPKEEENASLKGDANGDNKVDFMDILVINKHRLGKIKLTGVYLEKADVTRDGKVDFMDILQINKYRLGKINSL